MTTLTPETLRKLQGYDTPTICNLIELFEIRPRNLGFMDGRIKACFPEMPPLVGFAATASFRSSAPPSQGDAYGDLADQVSRFDELSGPAVVVFQDLDDPVVAATFGEVMCTTYQAFGSIGLITSGAGRDLDQVRAIGFPVFTGFTICAHGHCHILHIHTPVHVGGVVIYPDDLLHGDLNGVTTLPKEIASDLPDVGEEFMAAEAVVIQAMREGSPSVAALREARRESQAQIARLKERVSRRS